MATKMKSRPAPHFPDLEPLTELLRTPPQNTGDRQVRIRALGHRIDAYVRYMCAVGKMGGTSAEAKEEAIAYFYERLVVCEQELGQIHENLMLR